MTQVASQNLTDSQIAAMISSKNADTYVRIYELLPQFIRSNDPDSVLRGFFEAVQSEFDRSKSSITEVLTILDPNKVNSSYVLDGNPLFFHPEQFAYGVVADELPPRLDFSGSTSGVAASGFYRDFGVFVWADATTPESVGQYRIISSYDGLTQTAYVDEDWEVMPSPDAVYALCWPDRVWLPVALVSDPRKAGATVFPDQDLIGDEVMAYIDPQYTRRQLIALPGLSYLATGDDYYVNWVLDFMDGVNVGRSVKIVKYYAEDRILVLDEPVDAPDTGDWFRISPPVESNINISDNFYKGRWLHIAATSPGDVIYGQNIRSQTRQIIRSVFNPLAVPASHIAYIHDPVSGDGQKFKAPPAPTMLYGISNSYIPLQHLASFVGIDLDEEDQEVNQREQISQAYNFHRLRGTRKAIELVCRSIGLDVSVDEALSNYVSAPSEEQVGPDATPDLNHVQYSGSPDTIIKQGRGIDDVPAAYLVPPGRDAARIQDSDIKLYLSRTSDNQDEFNNRVLSRIVRRLNPFIPIHVQIIFIGLLTKINDKVAADENLTCEIRPLIADSVGVHEVFLGTPIGKVPTTDNYTVYANDGLAIKTAARYRNMSARYGKPAFIDASARWTLGSTLLID